MNLAFPALFVLLFLLPGILLSYSYRRGFFRRSPITLGPIRDEIGRGIVLAIFVHLAAFGLSWWWTGWLPKADVFLAVFTGVGGVAPSDAAEEFKAGLSYLVATNVAALVVGGGLHGIVRTSQLDLRWEWLRFNNEWHYLFSGEVWLFEKKTDQTVDWVFASVVVDQGEASILYWGRLIDYVFDRAGTLDKIILTQAQRRFLTPESDRDNYPPDEEEEIEGPDLPPASDRYYPIRGEYFVIEYENVQTLNVEYYEVLDEE
jgi:hypothetical protein